MKTVAIVANLAQLFIIPAVLLVYGIELGFWVILLLVLLTCVPLINFLAFFFASHPILKTDEPGADDGTLIKRSAIRVRYPLGRRAALEIDDVTFSVCDLSEFGVRILADRKTPFNDSVKGTIRLKSGTDIDFHGTVMRRNDEEVAFQFSDSIGTSVLLEENKAIKETDHE